MFASVTIVTLHGLFKPVSQCEIDLAEQTNRAMEPIGTAIAVDLLSAFIYDTLKLAKGEETSPLTEAIESTVRYFEGIEGLGATLRQWLLDPRVAETLRKYVEGETGRNEVQIPILVSALLNNTQFYLGENSSAGATEIIELFLAKVS